MPKTHADACIQDECIHVDEDGILQCFVDFTRPSGNFIQVSMLDGAYKVNSSRMPLYTTAVVDREGVGQPVAHALVGREDQTHIELFLSDLKSWVDSNGSRTFIADKDCAGINALKVIFPESKIFSCRVHIMKSTY